MWAMPAHNLTSTSTWRIKPCRIPMLYRYGGDMLRDGAVATTNETAIAFNIIKGAYRSLCNIEGAK